MEQQTGTRLVDVAVASLRSRIASGEWSVGSRIPTEPELCELLGVGRSTVREAIRALTTLGMVEPLTARGTYVRSAAPAPALLADALAVYPPIELVGLRRALDVEAAQSAAAQRIRVDLERLEVELEGETERLRGDGPAASDGLHCIRFHSAIAHASGNRLLVDLEAGLSAVLRSSGLAQRIAATTDAALRIDEHDRILTAIRAKDVGAAAHHMAIHADAALRSLHHEPIVTDLTTLASSVAEDSSAAGGASTPAGSSRMRGTA